MNASTSLTAFEQRGTLAYTNRDFTYNEVEGWFYLQGNTVVMRRLRGRNRFALCRVALVLDFTPHTTKGNK